MSVEWEKVGNVSSLKCNKASCDGLVVCTHTFDLMTSAAPEDLQVPSGTVRLPMAGEFPNPTVIDTSVALTAERLGSFDVRVSEPLNDYGTRKIELPIYEEPPQFLMMLNPEDAIVSIYQTTQEFINSQVGYKAGDRFGNCSGTAHRINMQTQLNALVPFVDIKPMLRFWDLLSKLQTDSCIVCMWKRATANVSAGSSAAASGLGDI